MNSANLTALLSSANLGAQIKLNKDSEAFVRFHFLYASTKSGLLVNLKKWTGKDDLLGKLGVRRPELLDSLLETGIALGEIKCRANRYKICGVRSLALAEESADALSAMVEEYVTYHGDAYRHLPERMLGELPLGSYLDELGPLVARSSRVLEPFMKEFVKSLVRWHGSLRLLEIGCGSGIYIRHAAETNPLVSGIGIDLQPEVVKETSASLRQWGLESRFKILEADIRKPGSEFSGPFDLITSYNNIYYFGEKERAGLFASLRSLLKPGGRLALVSAFQGNSTAMANFDLVLRSTRGCAPLPRLDELISQLSDSGFKHIKTTRLLPGQAFYGMICQ